MKTAISVLLYATLAFCGFAGEKKPEPEKKQLPKAKLISEDLYDTTERWQAMFGLDGKLKISKGRRDATQAPIDGPVFLSFTAKPQKAGFYTFTFIRVDSRQRVYQVHAVRLTVADHFKNAKPPAISPAAGNNQAQFTAATGAEVKVSWSYYPGGEGIEGGWRLSSVTYADRRSPAIPGFEKGTGE